MLMCGLSRRPAAAVAAAVAELGLDSEFKARLEAHNKVVNKGKCLYEPAKSVRDYRKVSQSYCATHQGR